MFSVKSSFFIILITTLGILASTMIPVSGKELEWKSYNATVEDLTDPVHSSTHTFNTQYRIFNGTGTIQVHNYAFIANLDSKTNGMLELQIPKNFPYYNGKDGPSEMEKYIVIENGYNLTSNQYTKTTSDCFFTYSIPFYMNSTITVESTDTLFLVTPIYGDKIPDYCMSKTMIPEFPLAVPVLLISSILSIVFYRIKFRK